MTFTLKNNKTEPLYYIKLNKFKGKGYIKSIYGTYFNIKFK